VRSPARSMVLDRFRVNGESWLLRWVAVAAVTHETEARCFAGSERTLRMGLQFVQIAVNGRIRLNLRPTRAYPPNRTSRRACGR
jgi:hypothetical protein